jgi:hypothetical protein
MPISDKFASFFGWLSGLCLNLVPFIPPWAQPVAAIVVVLFLASLILIANGLKDPAGWLLDTSTLVTTITIAVIGWKLTEQQDAHNSTVI